MGFQGPCGSGKSGGLRKDGSLAGGRSGVREGLGGLCPAEGTGSRGWGLTSWSWFARPQLHTSSFRSRLQTAEPRPRRSRPRSAQPPCPWRGPEQPPGHLSGARDPGTPLSRTPGTPRGRTWHPSAPTPGRGDAHLVVVSQVHRVPLAITQAAWDRGADHRAGLAWWEDGVEGCLQRLR